MGVFLADIQEDVHCHQQGNGGAEDGVHDGDAYGLAEEIEVTVHGILDRYNHFGRNTVVLHFCQRATHGVVTHQGGAVGSREEGDDLLQAFGEGGDGHIRAADKAVACTDDGANGRNLSLRRKEKVDHRGQGCAEADQQHHIGQEQQNVRNAHIPAGDGNVQKAKARGNEANQQGGNQRGDVIAGRQYRRTHRGNGQIPDGAIGLVLHHEKVGAEGNRDAGNCQQRGNQLSSHQTVDQIFG